MRVQQGANTGNFTTWLLELSYDSNWHGQIKLPPFIRTVNDLTALCNFVYPPELFLQAHLQHTTFQNRAILAPHNDTVGEFNLHLLQMIQGQLHSFYAEDTVDVNNAEAGIDHLPVEYLQSLNPASLPPSHLQLRVGAPIILLRNLDPKQGLCNGTRMVVTRLGQRCIEVVSLTGQYTGIYTILTIICILTINNTGVPKLLPRIPLSTTEGELPFILTRKQFPIRLCFAMTINKAQGQSLDVVGVDLRIPVFTHGQLYVALSRATNVDCLVVLQPDTAGIVAATTNIVYPEVLLHVHNT